jgi:hypothetical protein
LAATGELSGLVRQLFQRRLTVYMQRQIDKKALSLDLAYFESPAFFDCFQRAQQEVGHRQYLVLSLGRQIVMIVSSFCIPITNSVWIVLAAFLVVLPIRAWPTTNEECHL